jgi:5-methylcytosine-specific restriction endonuclease McrA
MGRDLNRRIDTLFPERKTVSLACSECEWERIYQSSSALVRVFRFAREGCPQCGSRLDPPEYRDMRDGCRVCGEEVVDGRWKYCSTRCRDIAKAVQRMFTWSSVRESVLERDDYTCQSCGHVERPPVTDGALHVDHIQRVADSGHKWDESNLQTLCHGCHEAKTAEENSTTEHPEITLEDYL